MQETRQHILEILREYGEATVDDIVAHLQQRRGKITAVTVRHHLMRLQEDHLITPPQLRHRNTPGRPQHVYALTEKASEFFPNNYQHLATHLLASMRENLPAQGVNVILEGVAVKMASEAEMPDVPLRQKISIAVEYLNSRGYSAAWAESDGGYILQTSNCPYHYIASQNTQLCDMDLRLVATLLGIVPRMLSRMSSGDAVCAYFIPA